MAKYSTGTDAGGGEHCELCGERSTNLEERTVAGAELLVCPSCSSHGSESSTRQETKDETSDRDRRAATNTARVTDARSRDSTHWEQEGTNYDEDPLPYLVSGYGDRAREARENENLSVGDLAAELDTTETDLRAIEANNASSADVGGSVIYELEARFDIELAE